MKSFKSEQGIHPVDRQFELYPLGTQVFDDQNLFVHVDRGRWLVEGSSLDSGIYGAPFSPKKKPLLHKLPDKKLYLQPDSYTCLQACLATYLGIPFYYVLERIPSTPDKDKYPFAQIESLLQDFGLSHLQLPVPFSSSDIASGLYIAGVSLPGGAEHCALVYVANEEQRKILCREGEHTFLYEHCPIRAKTPSEVFEQYKMTHLWLFPKLVFFQSSLF